MLRYWRRAILRSFLRYRKGKENGALSNQDTEAVCDCLNRVTSSTTWGWDGSLRAFFWNWPSEWHSQIRDGFKMWLRSEQVNWYLPQPKPSARNRPLMMKKLLDVREKGYLKKGKATSLIRFFGVPKEIRIFVWYTMVPSRG